jgi:hypothetical protein
MEVYQGTTAYRAMIAKSTLPSIAGVMGKKKKKEN